MTIIQLQFYLIVCCAAAKSFTETSVDLGQNVTLKCEVDVREVHWFLMKPSEPPVYILRSFTSRPVEPQYSDTAFSKTFSVQHNSSLFIRNVSTNELGVYYCIQTGSPPNISSGIRLYIRNHSDGNQPSDVKQELPGSDKPGAICHWSVPLSTSVMMNVALATVVTVLTVRHCRRPPNTRAGRPDPGPQPDSPSTGYADVQLSPPNGRVRMTNLTSTYALLQLPNP